MKERPHADARGDGDVFYEGRAVTGRQDRGLDRRAATDDGIAAQPD
jgi:hypothetical protein